MLSPLYHRDNLAILWVEQLVAHTLFNLPILRSKSQGRVQVGRRNLLVRFRLLGRSGLPSTQTDRPCHPHAYTGEATRPRPITRIARARTRWGWRTLSHLPSSLSVGLVCRARVRHRPILNPPKQLDTFRVAIPPQRISSLLNLQVTSLVVAMMTPSRLNRLAVLRSSR